MAGWSIAQNPLLLPRDQPCNVLGNFCNGLTYCQQRNLSGFYMKTQVYLTRLRRRVKGALDIGVRCVQTRHIMQEKKTLQILTFFVQRTLEYYSRATYSQAWFHGWSCWMDAVLACWAVGDTLHCGGAETMPENVKFMILFLALWVPLREL